MSRLTVNASTPAVRPVAWHRKFGESWHREGKFMNAAKCVAALVLLLPLAGAAEAKSFAWCQLSGDKYQNYLSDVVEIDDGPDAFRAFRTGAFGNGFRQFVQSSLDSHAAGLDCNKQETRFFADDYIGVLISSNPGYKFVRTGWHGGRAAASLDRQQKHSPGGGEARDNGLHYRR